MSVVFAGLVLLIASNTFRVVSRTAVAGVDISIYFERGADDHQFAAVKNVVSAEADVVDVRFVSSDEAWQWLADNLSDKAPLLDGLDADVLPPSLELKLKPGVNAQILDGYAAAWGALDGVSDVQHTRLSGPHARGAVGLVRWVAWAAGALALAVSAVVVILAFQVALLSRREELDVMRVMGAMGARLWGPVALGGLLQGVIAAVVGLGLLFGVFRIIGGLMPDWAVLGQLSPVFLNAGQCLVLVAWGALLGLSGSVFGVARVARWS